MEAISEDELDVREHHHRSKRDYSRSPTDASKGLSTSQHSSHGRSNRTRHSSRRHSEHYERASTSRSPYRSSSRSNRHMGDKQSSHRKRSSEHRHHHNSPAVSRSPTDRKRSPRQKHSSSSSSRTLTKEKSQRRRRRSRERDHEHHDKSHPINAPLVYDPSNEAINTLYGNDSDVKSKASSPRATNPGIEQIDGTMNRSIHTLYGSDADAKAKAKASVSSPESYASRSPGVQQVSSSVASSSAASTLYGSDADAKAKAKASRGGSEFASHPGVASVGTTDSTAISTLYGSEADAKAKAKASRGSSKLASHPGVASVGTANNTTLLYGNDADAKAKIRATRGGAAVPGVESLANWETSSEHSQTIVHEGVGHTDSESFTSHSEPPSPVNDGRSGVSAVAMEGFQVPNDPEATVVQQGKSKKQGAREEKKKSKKRCILLFLLFLFLIGAAGVAVWYFLLRTDTTSRGNQIGNTTVQDPTKSPSSPITASFAPTQPSAIGISSMFPSAAPSTGLLYTPPSKSNCEAIAANQTIAGRDEKENAYFELGVEVVLFDNSTLTKPLLQALLDAIQRKILPSLAGCSVIIDELVEAWRFVIFDAFVTGSVPPDESCTDKALMQLNCHRVSVKLDLFLKGNVRFLDIIALISAEGDNIANHLELDDLFSIIKLIGAESLIPTEAPTRMPSAVPSFSPTGSPTVLASSNPTDVPSVMPTRAPTGEPSLSPTILPSAVPSMVPSTTAPTADPSAQPTGVPSESPSVRPTTIISDSPTKSPTRPPSPRPTKAPTMTPSRFPTGSPSSTPSSRPTSSPTPAPTYAVVSITQAHGPYTNYPVSQSTTGWGGPAILAIDGNNSGVYSDGSVTHTMHGLTDQWWQVDLATGAGRPVVVKYITVWNRSSWSSRLDGAVVHLLDASLNDITPSTVNTVLTDAREQTIDFGLIPDVSFVKITKDYNILSLAEVEIYGYVPLKNITQSVGTTIALHENEEVAADDDHIYRELSIKVPGTSPSRSPTTPAPTYVVEIITQAHGPYTNYPVSQSSIGWGGEAIRAIDGNNSGRYRDRSVTHTSNGLDQWWQVDLATGAGRSVVVKHITVWNRTDGCCTSRIIGAVVRLLDANQNDITPANIDNVLPDARETTIDYGLVPNVSFVKISKDSTISLAEVEIHGYVSL